MNLSHDTLSLGKSEPNVETKTGILWKGQLLQLSVSCSVGKCLPETLTHTFSEGAGAAE